MADNEIDLTSDVEGDAGIRLSLSLHDLTRASGSTLWNFQARGVPNSMPRMLLVMSMLALAGSAGAQPEIRKSQLATVSQMVGSARIEIVYRRPVARGRELFGGIVPYGRPWSPSADSAALFTASRDLEVEGLRLAAGRYSVWAIPGRETWTVIFSSAQPVFHLPYPEGRDVLRVRAPARAGDHMETLAFYFPVVDADSAILNLHWGKTVVPLSVRGK
ncbi:MAG: DUF2911 domain-containing protein [Gemmatimonadaceae bacterium]|nr:DUF2911 domain-containing protein [Gemmatimonadaceae bacterium]